MPSIYIKVDSHPLAAAAATRSKCHCAMTTNNINWRCPSIHPSRMWSTKPRRERDVYGGIILKIITHWTKERWGTGLARQLKVTGAPNQRWGKTREELIRMAPEFMSNCLLWRERARVCDGLIVFQRSHKSNFNTGLIATKFERGASFEAFLAFVINPPPCNQSQLIHALIPVISLSRNAQQIENPCVVFQLINWNWTNALSFPKWLLSADVTHWKRETRAAVDCTSDNIGVPVFVRPNLRTQIAYRPAAHVSAWRTLFAKFISVN